MERYVPKELCFQIFLNLPVKSLLRFKCVCKSWNKIFSSKSFSHSYLAHKKSSSNTKKYLLFEHDDFYSAHIIDGTKTCYDVETMNYMQCYRPIFPETGLEQYESCFLKVYGVCNGLLCLSDGQLRMKSTIYLWNPIARRGKKFLDPHVNHKTGEGVPYSLAFGYHDDDYKVIKIARYSDTYRVLIYSLSNDAWDYLRLNLLDNIHYDEHDDKYMQYPNAMLVNGVAYFLKEEPFQVVCFDIGYERIQVVDLPEHFNADTSFVMKPYGESLALLEYCESGLSTELVVWTLRGILRWEKSFRVDTECSYPLGFIDDGKIILRAFDSYEFRLFNLVTNQFTELKFRQGFETLEERRALWGIDSFVESLVLLDKSTTDEYIVTERCSAHTTAFTLQKWKTSNSLVDDDQEEETEGPFDEFAQAHSLFGLVHAYI